MPAYGSEGFMVDRDKLEGLIRNLRRYTEVLRQIAQRDETRFMSDPVDIGLTWPTSRRLYDTSWRTWTKAFPRSSQTTELLFSGHR